MIPTIICSKSRAGQLDLLLSSIEKNGNNLFDPIYVVMKASDEEYLKGYEKLTTYHNNFEFINEELFDGFHRSMMEALFRCQHLDDNKYLVFFVDDNILYRPLTINYDRIDNLFAHGVDTLSLRLGRNVYIQNPQTGEHSRIPKQFHKEDGFYTWNINDVAGFSNYNYPLSLDGHIFEKERITNTIIDTEFSSPNFLEGNLEKYKRSYSSMACQELSCIVNSPLNRVQDVFTNYFSQRYYQDPEKVNKMFLDGYRYNLNKIDFSNICGCHVELDLVMEK